MSLFAHRFDLTISVLFLAAGGISALAGAALYRLALVIIVLLLRALWARAAMRRSRSNLLTAVESRARARSAKRREEAPQESDRLGSLHEALR
jgi:uncharacterized membrane protein YhiD involved in acid resistance